MQQPQAAVLETALRTLHSIVDLVDELSELRLPVELSARAAYDAASAAAARGASSAEQVEAAVKGAILPLLVNLGRSYTPGELAWNLWDSTREGIAVTAAFHSLAVHCPKLLLKRVREQPWQPSQPSTQPGMTPSSSASQQQAAAGGSGKSFGSMQPMQLSGVTQQQQPQAQQQQPPLKQQRVQQQPQAQQDAVGKGGGQSSQQQLGTLSHEQQSPAQPTQPSAAQQQQQQQQQQGVEGKDGGMGGQPEMAPTPSPQQQQQQGDVGKGTRWRPRGCRGGKKVQSRKGGSGMGQGERQRHTSSSKPQHSSGKHRRSVARSPSPVAAIERLVQSAVTAIVDLSKRKGKQRSQPRQQRVQHAGAKGGGSKGRSSSQGVGAEVVIELAAEEGMAVPHLLSGHKHSRAPSRQRSVNSNDSGGSAVRIGPPA